jgi:hypothetical protein
MLAIVLIILFRLNHLELWRPGDGEGVLGEGINNVKVLHLGMVADQ